MLNIIFRLLTSLLSRQLQETSLEHLKGLSKDAVFSFFFIAKVQQLLRRGTFKISL